jgi:hypothetical protein
MPTTHNMESQTLSLDCWSFNVTDSNENGTLTQSIPYKELDTHSLYGTKETQVT